MRSSLKKDLEMTQDPTLAWALDALISSDPNTYFLRLAQHGAKLLKYFNVETLREKSTTHVVIPYMLDEDMLVFQCINQPIW